MPGQVDETAGKIKKKHEDLQVERDYCKKVKSGKKGLKREKT